MIRWLRILIWAYLVLLLGEGALRKWVLFSFADPLLIVRDPVLLAIYVLACAAGVFPRNGFITVIAVLALFSAALAFLTGNDNLVVVAYGLRINFLHLPLIWIMGEVIHRRDVERMGVFILLAAIPMTIVMVEQFRSPVTAAINRGIGGDTMGQIFGADGRIRPPGLFAFITGPQLFYPLAAAFFFHGIGGGRRSPWYLLLAGGLAIAVALPVSISRTVMLATALVGGVFALSLPFVAARVGRLVRPALLLIAVAFVLSRLPIFQEGAEVFMMRWETAAAENDGDAWSGVVERTVTGFTNPLHFMQIAPLLGHGIGMGSNVASRLLSGGMGFMLAEEEWGKVLLELGPVLGSAFILFRLVLVGYLGWRSWRALRDRRDNLPLLLLAASALNIAQGQWGPPTALGFAVVSAGLVLAATRPSVIPAPQAVAAPLRGRAFSRPSRRRRTLPWQHPASPPPVQT